MLLGAKQSALGMLAASSTPLCSLLHVAFNRVFLSTDPLSRSVKYPQVSSTGRPQNSSYLLVTGLVIIAVVASFFAFTYVYIKRKYGSMSTAVQQIQVQYNIARRAV